MKRSTVLLYGALTFSKGSQACTIKLFTLLMQQRTIENVNNYLDTNLYSYLETSGVQSYI